MVKKYILVRMPIEAYKGFEDKRKKMQTRVKTWTGKDVKIPFTQALRVISSNPTEIHENKIIKLVKKPVRRVKKCVV